MSHEPLIPEPTARLAFRQMTDHDLDDMAALLGDPAVMRYYPQPMDRRQAGAGSSGTRSSTGSAGSASGC